MSTQLAEPGYHAGNLVNLLSSPEGSLLWAAGMRHEIQACMAETDFDRDYVGHCLGLLLRTGGWRLLRNAKDNPFRSFIQFCYARRPYGLGLTRAQMEPLLVD
jgi:hypothetical protein